MNLWHDLPVGPNPPVLIHVIVEIPSITRNKYEFDHHGGFFRLNRVLSSTLHFPAEYGLIPRTLYDDGDPLDVLVLIKEPTFTGCVIVARPLGILRMMDQDASDDKILAVADADPVYQNYHGLGDVSQQYQDEVAHFFDHYKDLEGKRVQIQGWKGRETALMQIGHAQRLYREKFGATA